MEGIHGYQVHENQVLWCSGVEQIVYIEGPGYHHGGAFMTIDGAADVVPDVAADVGRQGSHETWCELFWVK